MKPLIIISKKDPAGMSIAKQLRKLNIEYELVENESIYAGDEVNEKSKDFDFVIFATKHESAAKEKTLTIHAPGNWKQAKYGGQENKVCKTSAMFLKLLFNILNHETEKQKLKDYKISLEATHHGPLIEKPCCFIEIGSSLNEWQDEKAAEIIATTIKRALEHFAQNASLNTLSKDSKVLLNSKSNNISDNVAKIAKGITSTIAIGGPHYCPNFNKIQLNSKYAISHIIPEYIFPLTKEIIKQAIEKTIEPVKTAIIDWKGCGKSKEREEIINILKELNLEVLRTDKIK